jgi:hypothetical protein
MARPPKKAADRMEVDLRIPVTRAQKRLVADAMATDGQEFAEWARKLLLTAAEKRLAGRSDSASRK